jgi:hypothetical protein
MIVKRSKDSFHLVTAQCSANFQGKVIAGDSCTRHRSPAGLGMFYMQTLQVTKETGPSLYFLCSPSLRSRGLSEPHVVVHRQPSHRQPENRSIIATNWIMLQMKRSDNTFVTLLELDTLGFRANYCEEYLTSSSEQNSWSLLAYYTFIHSAVCLTTGP